MIQEREAVKCIEDEMAQLAENKRGLEEDLVCLGIALAPHNHSILPNKVLIHIFVLLARDYGTVTFPIQKKNVFHNKSFPMYAHTGEGWRFVHLSYGVTRM
jgi:hypothetical protein